MELGLWPGSDSKGLCYIAFASFFSVVPGNSPISVARLFNNQQRVLSCYTQLNCRQANFQLPSNNIPGLTGWSSFSDSRLHAGAWQQLNYPTAICSGSPAQAGILLSISKKIQPLNCHFKYPNTHFNSSKHNIIQLGAKHSAYFNRRRSCILESCQSREFRHYGRKISGSEVTLRRLK